MIQLEDITVTKIKICIPYAMLHHIVQVRRNSYRDKTIFGLYDVDFYILKLCIIDAKLVIMSMP